MCLTEKSYTTYARVAQLVEYDLAKVGAAGSSPVSRFCFLNLICISSNLWQDCYKRDIRNDARVAQLVEYDLAKVGAAGSSPVSRSS